MRMLRPMLAPTVLLLLLSACGGDADRKTAPVADEGIVFRPGRWQVTNMVAGGIRQTEHLCVTEAQARSGRFLAGDLPAGCALDRNIVADGRIDLAIRCGQMSSTVTGTYDADTYSVESTNDLGAGEAMRATSAATFAGEECQQGDVGMQVE